MFTYNHLCLLANMGKKITNYLVLSAPPVTGVLRSETTFKAADTVYTVMLLGLY